MSIVIILEKERDMSVVYLEREREGDRDISSQQSRERKSADRLVSPSFVWCVEINLPTIGC